MNFFFPPRPGLCGLRTLLGAALALAAPLGAADNSVASSAAGSPRLFAPAVENTLTNGLRYIVQPHGTGLGRVSVRLVVAAGSLDERDDERGYAHFVEHMAFNGSRHFPPGKVVEFLQKLGLSFGADLWAGTTFTHTIYKLDLPAGHAADFGEALRVLRDFADGIAFAPEEVEREKGVVLSELAAREDAGWRVAAQQLQALYGGTLLPERLPSGLRATIEAASATSLRGFYQRCYRPRRMTLVVTGDIPATTAVAGIEQAFGSLAAAETSVAPVATALPAFRGPRAHVVLRPASSAATAQIAVLLSHDATTPAVRRDLIAQQLVLGLLDQRLAGRRARDRNEFGDADASVQAGGPPAIRHLTLSASTAAARWPVAVSLLEQELRRAREQGFSAVEVREVVSTYLAQHRADRDASGGQTSDLMAERIVAAVQSSTPWRAPAEAVGEAESFLADFSPEMATTALRALFAADRLQLLLFAQQPPKGGSAAVLAAYRESATRPLEATPPPSARDLEFRYRDFGAPGTIAEQRKENDLTLDRVRFGNGVALNVRASVSEPGRFQLSARFGRGLPDLPRDRPGLPHLATHLLAASDLGRHTQEELRRLLGLRAIEYHVGYDRQLVITMEGPTGELPFALRLLTAQISDARLDAARLAAAHSDYAACRERRLDGGLARAAYATVLHMTGGDSRLREPTLEMSNAYAFADVAKFLRTRWLEGALEVALVGDFDAAAAVTSTAATLGTLPARRPPNAVPGAGVALRTTSAHETLAEPLAEQVASVMIAWPAPRLHEPRRRWALRLTTDILEDRLQKTLREQLGATYSPHGEVVHDPRHPELGLALVGLTFDPARAGELTKQAIGIAEELGRRGVTPEEFSRLKPPLATSVAESLRTNDWWNARILAHAQSAPAVLDEARTIVGTVDRLTRDEVNRIAAEHFRPGAASSVIVTPVAPERGTIAADTAAGLINRGEVKSRAGDLAGALADFDAAIALNPASAPAYSNRAAVKLQQGDHAGTLADSTRAIDLDPKLTLAYSNRIAARTLLGDLDGALADATEALRLDPGNDQAHNNRGVVRQRKGDGAGAMADWSRAIELNPGNAQAFANRGRLRLNQGNTDGAIADAQTAVELEPELTDGWYALGFARQTKGDLDGAITAYTRAIALAPAVPDYHRHRARLRQLRGDLAGSLADFNEAVRLNPRDADSLCDRGVLRQSRKDLTGALADYTAAIELQPRHAIAHVNRAGVRQALGDLDGALADATKAIALDPTLADAYNNRGYVRQGGGDLDGAIADYTQAITLNPRSAQAYRNRAEAKKARGDRLGAIDDFDQAHKLSPPPPLPPAASINLPPPAGPVRPSPPPASTPAARKKGAAPAAEALALLRSGNAKRTRRDLPGALADLDRAIALSPGMAEAHLARGSVRAARNDPKGAIADYTRAIELKPDLFVAYVERGNVHRIQRELDLAVADYDAAIKLQPKHALAHYNRGLAHQGRLDHAAAGRDFDTAIALNPTSAPAFNARGYSRQARGNIKNAIADYTTAIELLPSYVPAYFNRGFARQVSGELAGARADYDKVIELSPNYTNVHANRANVRHAQGDFVGALADYDRVIGLTRTSGGYPRLFRAVVHRRLQRDDLVAELAGTLHAWPAGWTKTIARFLAGELDESALLAAANDRTGGAPPSRPCEAHYFAGMMRLFAGDTTRAREHFEISVATNQRRLASFLLARTELARLPEPAR